MTNSTADWPGFIKPTSSIAAPTEDLALDAVLASIVVGIVGLDANLVRPRWQPTPPKVPEVSVDWCAVGVTDEETTGGIAGFHNGAGEGTDTVLRQETIGAVASFYGPNAKGNAKLLREGLFIAQNRDMAKRLGLNFVEVGNIISTGDLVNTVWRRRADIELTFTRMVEREYLVKNLLSARVSPLTFAGDAPTLTQSITVPKD